MKNRRIFKSIISFLLILSIVISPFPDISLESKASAATDADHSFIKGDIDNDGEINSIDLVLLKMHLLGNKTLTGDYLEAADFNSDGSVDSLDLALLKRHLLEGTPDDGGNTDPDDPEVQTFSVAIEENEKPEITGVSVTMEAAGDIQNSTSITNVYNIDEQSSNVPGLIGVPVRITSSSQFNEATITFFYNESLLGDTKEEDLAVMWYDEENDLYRIFDEETVVDTVNDTVSYTTAHFSTYMVVDKQKWYASQDTDSQAPSMPSELTVTAKTDTTVTFCWIPSVDNVGIASYDVYMNGTKIGTVNEPVYSVSDLTADTAYIFMVIARDGAGNLSAPSAPITVNTDSVFVEHQAPSAPANLMITAATGSAISLKWNASGDNVAVEKYEVFCNDNSIGTTTDTSYTWIGLEQGLLYRFYVKAYDTAGNISDRSNTVDVNGNGSDNQPPTAPAYLTVESRTDTEIFLSWTASADDTGIAGYIIYRDGIELDTAIDTIYTDYSVDKYSHYTYTVKAYDASGNVSEESNSIYVTAEDNQAPTAPANLIATDVTSSTVALTWDASTDNVAVAGYDIYEGVHLVGAVTGSSIYYEATELEPGTEYEFMVKAKDGEGNVSEASNAVKVMTLLEKPLNLEAGWSEDGIIIRWNEVNGADGYELSINGEIVDVGNVTSYVQTDVLPNCKYEYKVRYIKNHNPGAWSDPKELFTAPGKVLNLAAKVTDDKTIELTWDIVEGALSYEVEINGTIVEVVTENKYLHSNILAGSVNNYRVRATNGELKGIWSDSVLQAAQIIIAGGTISQDTIWDGSSATYLVTGDLTIAQGVTLQIMPGTIVKFNIGKGIKVCGKLLSEGVNENPIVFTSLKDPEYGGSGVTSWNDSWKGINVENTGEFVGDNIKIKFGGYSYSNLNVQGALDLKNSIVSNSFDRGIIISSGNDVMIDNTTIEGSRYYNILINKIADSGTITLRNNMIRNSISSGGIFVQNLAGNGMVIDSNTIIENYSNPISISLSGLTSPEALQGIYSNNTFNGNKESDAIAIGGDLKADTTLIKNMYTIQNVTIASGVTLTIQSGTVLLGDRYGRLDIKGKLVALGTKENPIVFTSSKDSAYGGRGEMSADDDWRGITINNTGEFIGDNVKISYGGFHDEGNLNVQGALDLKNSVISNSFWYGIKINSGNNVTIQNTTIENSEFDNIYINQSENSGTITLRNNMIRNSIYRSGIKMQGLTGSGLIIENNNIVDNCFHPMDINLTNLTSPEALQGIVLNNIYSGNKESDAIAIAGVIKVDTTLPKYRYAITSLFVENGATLTIQPGTVVLSRRSGGLYIYGKLVALGTKENPIVFTSSRDSAYGGRGVISADDIWKGITINNTGEFIGDNVKINYGGFDDECNLNVQGALDLKNSVISNSFYCGIIINSGNNVTIQNTTIENSQYYNIIINKIANSGTITLKNNMIRNTRRGSGIYIYCLAGNGLIIENNNIVDNYTKPILIFLTKLTCPEALQGIALNNNFSGNKQADSIEIVGLIKVDTTLPKNRYTIRSVTVESGATLTIQPGSVLFGNLHHDFLNGKYMNIKGKLVALGTKENPIVFTSGKDPEYGGDTKYVENAVNGRFTDDWRGITIENTGEFIGDNVKFKYSNDNALNVQGSLILSNSIILNSRKYGIYFNTSINPVLLYNSFKNNDYAIYNDNSNIVIDAKYNYWDSLFGPSIYTEVYNPDTKKWDWKWVGSGEKISGSVDYSPYLGSELTMDIHFNEIQGAYTPTGNYSKQYNDMSVDCLEGTLSFTRFYNSQDRDIAGGLGEGWFFNYESGITDYEDLPNIKIVKLPDGSRESYTTNNDGSFTANTSRNTLEKQSDGTYLLTTKDQINYGFNSDGKLIWIENKQGNRLIIRLNSDGRPQSMTDYAGREYSFTYQNNHLKTIEDSQGRQVTYEYNNGMLKKVIDPEGIVTHYDYDENGNLSEISDGNDNVIEAVAYKGDSKDTKVYQVTDAYGDVKTYTYDEVKSKTIITDSNGNETTQWFDTTYNITDCMDADGKITSATYSTEGGRNKYGEVKSSTDRNGNTTTYNRDDRGNITKVTNPDASFKQYTYDDRNNLTGECDEAGKWTYYIYDASNTYLLKVVRPLNGTDKYSDSDDQSRFAITTYTYYESGYAIKGLVKTVIDPEGNIITYTYDRYGNVKTETDSRSNTTTNTYNIAGLLTNTTSPKGEVTMYTYDQNGNLETMVQAGGETTQIVYDELGRKSREITPNIYQATPSGDVGYRYTYYKSGLVKTTTDPENNTTIYTYDLYGNLSTETKPNSCMYSYEYDVLNRVAKVYVQDSNKSEKVLQKSYAYSILSNKNSQTTETIYLNETETAATVYLYDYAGRLIKQTNPDGGILSIKYNTNGTAYSSTDALGKTSYYRYDGLNRLTEQWLPFGDSKYTYKKIEYDNNGNKTAEKIGIEAVSLWSIPATLITTAYVYGENNLLKTVTDPENCVTEYDYDENGNTLKQTVYLQDSSTKVTEYEYNHLGKIVSMTQHVDARDIYGNAENDTADISLVTSYTYDANGNVKSVTTPDNIITSYEYDTLDRMTTETVQGLDECNNSTEIVTSMTYDFAGNVLTATDANGGVTQNIYSGKGLLEKTIDPEGGITAYYYDNAGRLTAKILPENFKDGAALPEMSRAVFTYDNMNRIILEQDIYYDEEVISFKTINSKANLYDLNGNIIKTVDALGYESGTGTTVTQKIKSGYGSAYTYNDASLLLTTLSPESKVSGQTFDVKYTYDAAGRKISETNANNVVTKYYYDKLGRLTKETVVDKTEKVLQQNTYDALGNLLTQTDGNGNTTTFTYNRLGLLRSQTLPGDASIHSNTTTNQYNAMGHLVYQKDSMSKEKIITYDHNGQILSRTEQKEDGSQSITISNSYDKNGNLRFATDANGVTTEYDYNGNNNVLHTKTTVSGVEQVTTNTYDKNGNRLTLTDWLGNTYANKYDALNRLTEKKDPYGKIIEKYEYNNNHAQVKAYDALGNATVFEYDKNNRLISTTDAENHVTSQAYDKAGNIATKTDGNNNVTIYGYDALNRLNKITNAKGEVTEYAYDLNGNMLTQKDGRGNVTTYEYNADDKVLRCIDHGGRTGTSGNYTYDEAKTESFTYYADGSLKSKTDKNGVTTAYIYDIHGRLKKQTVGGDSISYTYDANGNQLTMKDDTGITTRTYDEQNRVLTKAVPEIGTVTFRYDIIAGLEAGCLAEISIDPKGNETKKIYDKTGRLKAVKANGKTINYQYYDNGRRKSVIYGNGAREDYTYYKDGQLWILTNKNADGSIIDGYTYTYDAAHNQVTKEDAKGVTSYTYDELNRLKTVISPDNINTSYTYDKSGNRETETILQGSGTTVNTYSYNEQNRLIQISTKQNGNLTATTKYSYDNNGNQITATVNGTVTATNIYDNRNQLIKMVTGDITVENGYNGEGYRVEKKTNGELTRYLYEQDKVVLEVDGSGNQTGRNVYGTNLLVRTADGLNYYYMYNGHADVTALLKADGTIAVTYYYDAFGNVTDTTGSISNTITFAGYQYDEETGLYYLNARMYDPKTARFLQEDTYTGVLNDPLSLNLYTYCQNNPILYIDPTGHKAEKEDNWWNKIKKYYKKVIVTGTVGSILVANEISKTLGFGSLIDEDTEKTAIKTVILPAVKSAYVRTQQFSDWAYNKALPAAAGFFGGLSASISNNLTVNVPDVISRITIGKTVDQGRLHTIGNNHYAVSGYHIGKVVGDGIGAIAGAIETIFGGGMTTGGAVATSTGVGSPAGVPLMVQGAAVYSQGIATVETSIYNMASDVQDARTYFSESKGANTSQGGSGDSEEVGNVSKDLIKTPSSNPEDFTKLKGNQGYKDKDGNMWRKDQKHKDHWDISNKKGDKIREVDFDGKEIWPNGPKNKNKTPK